MNEPKYTVTGRNREFESAMLDMTDPEFIQALSDGGASKIAAMFFNKKRTHELEKREQMKKPEHLRDRYLQPSLLTWFR